MAKKPGSLWVDGGFLHYVDQTGREWRWLGDNLGPELGAKPGSLWLDTAAGPGLNRIHYITTGPNHRFIPSSSVLHHVDANAEQGSLWVEGDFLHFISNAAGQEIQAHMDVAHQDTNHSDVAHQDAAHDDHDDVTHSDHDDVPHQDAPHDDVMHEDVPHEDFHQDFHGDGDPHTDIHFDSHEDVPHQDVAHDDVPHVDHDDSASEHSDQPHADSPHGDSAHSDQSHDDRPEFIGP